MAKQKFYAFLIPGTGKSGVVSSWAEAEKQVKGVTGARYRGFDSKEEAEAWLHGGAEYEKKKKIRLGRGIYFDSGTGRGKGVEIRVTDEKGKDLLHTVFRRKDLTKFGTHAAPEATNNYGELLAAYHALRIALKRKSSSVFGDSALVVNFWSRGHVRKDVSIETEALAKKTAQLRKKFEAAGGKIKRISGDHNPADLGFH